MLSLCIPAGKHSTVIVVITSKYITDKNRHSDRPVLFVCRIFTSDIGLFRYIKTRQYIMSHDKVKVLFVPDELVMVHVTEKTVSFVPHMDYPHFMK
jgi:hypothetical protein